MNDISQVENLKEGQVKKLGSQEMPFVLYCSDDGKSRVKVLVHGDTIWLSQKSMAELLQTTLANISLHLKNIYYEEELVESATIKDYLIVQNEGARSVRRVVQCYNLDAIIAVGYRVNSKRATQFRIWATQVLKEYIRKGFVLDDDRLKQGKQVFGQDYFQELLERIRSIRTSERRIYQQITDIFAECSVDYDPKSEITQNFYAMVQNKFHFAITGKTAAEIIHSKIDSKASGMGLMTWKGFFDYIENVLEARRQMTMEDVVAMVDKFLVFNEYKILTHKGSVSKALADQKALNEYEVFNKTQVVESDFDKTVKRLSKVT